MVGQQTGPGPTGRLKHLSWDLETPGSIFDTPGLPGKEKGVKIKAASVEVDVRALTFEDLRKLTDEFLAKNPKEGKKWWDLMAAVRGPDIGLEGGPLCKADGSTPGPEAQRTERKKKTTTIIRGRFFPSTVNCSSADINDDPDAIVELPTKQAWDHFDKHIFKVCQAHGILYHVEGEPMPLKKGEAYGLQPAGDPVTVTIPSMHEVADYLKPGTLVVFSGAYKDQYVLVTDPQMVKFMAQKFDRKGYQNWQVKHLDLFNGTIELMPQVQVVVKAPSPVGLAPFPPNMWGLTEKAPNVAPLAYWASGDFNHLKEVAKMAEGSAKGPFYDPDHNILLRYMPSGKLQMILPAALKPAATKFVAPQSLVEPK
jgi:hypothetical protein